MKLSFAASIDDWTRRMQERMKAVLQEATANMIEEAETVGPSVKNPDGGAGGKMPVDTGFLRASMSISFDGMPSGPSRGDPKQAYAYDPNAITLKLAGVEIGKTIYAGWTAAYALQVEEKYGFCRSAAMNWQNHVSNAVERAKTMQVDSMWNNGQHL